MIRASQVMPQTFNASRAMAWKVWTDPTEVSLPKRLTMMATFGEEGKVRLAMRMDFVSAEARDQNVRE
jgi:hypothetical protein